METRETINIKSSQVSPRFRYVLSYLSEQLGIDFTINSDSDRTLYYSPKTIEDSVCIYDSGLLREKSISKRLIPVSAEPGNVQLFPSPSGFDFPLDIFSAIFYMLSRYEEYLPFEPDPYGRFEVSQGLAGRHGFAEEPVVDRWIKMFRTALVRWFPSIKVPERKFGFVSTIDVDSPWAYLHKGFLRNTAGILRSLTLMDWAEVSNRFSVITGRKKDPYDVYDYINRVEEKNGIRSAYFFLSGDYGGYDVNAAFRKTEFSELVTKIRAHNQVGIHPSYRSNINFNILKSEFKQFGAILRTEPELSRQHFLMLKLPDTYDRLVESGITHDYSMGYASTPGFRAGTSRPFKFYNLKKETETGLVVHPFVVMDVTLQQYLKLDPLQATRKIKQLIQKTAAVNGLFTWLWHNESLSEHGIWKGWRKVFEEMVGECKSVTGDW
ncbi:MAG TPA: polysaccharide deacetylase family protein [Bacteroidales bacterium]|nr:polysaccharide deacetylase family protein [Bacteroidales bacterium]